MSNSQFERNVNKLIYEISEKKNTKYWMRMKKKKKMKFITKNWWDKDFSNRKRKEKGSIIDEERQWQ